MTSSNAPTVRIHIGAFPIVVQGLASIAIKNRFFVSEWFMEDIFKTWIENKKSILPNDRITIAFINNRPVGTGIYHSKTNHVMIYVDGSHRRQGIGTKLCNYSTLHLTDNAVPSYRIGVIGSREFWNRQFEKS